jgi:hypothetical protein
MQLNDDNDSDDVYDHDRGVMIMMMIVTMMMMFVDDDNDDDSDDDDDDDDDDYVDYDDDDNDDYDHPLYISLTHPPSLPQYPLDRRGHQCQCGLVEGSRDPFALQVG